MTNFFYKYHGSGNDFIIIDNRSWIFPENSEVVRNLCRQHTGIGADGLVLIEESSLAQYKMRYFNSDGQEVDFCGNSLRCSAACIHRFLGSLEHLTIESNIGIHRAEIQSRDLCKVELGEFLNEMQQSVTHINDRELIIYSLKIGVPHLVIFVDDFKDFSVPSLGRQLRFHPDYQPNGTNVNFVVNQGHELRVRTYERGVEAETLACGSGGAAASLCALLLGKISPKDHVIPVRFAGGERVYYQLQEKRNFRWEIFLIGQAHYVFCGQITDDALFRLGHIAFCEKS